MKDCFFSKQHALFTTFQSTRHHEKSHTPILTPLPTPHLPPPKKQPQQNKKYGKWLTKSASSKAKQVFLGLVFQAVGFNFVSAFIENSIKPCTRQNMYIKH